VSTLLAAVYAAAIVAANVLTERFGLVPIGCDSVDGTCLVFGPNVNLLRLMSWLRTNDQYMIPLGVMA